MSSAFAEPENPRFEVRVEPARDVAGIRNAGARRADTMRNGRAVEQHRLFVGIVLAPRESRALLHAEPQLGNRIGEREIDGDLLLTGRQTENAVVPVKAAVRRPEYARKGLVGKLPPRTVRVHEHTKNSPLIKSFAELSFRKATVSPKQTARTRNPPAATVSLAHSATNRAIQQQPTTNHNI